MKLFNGIILATVLITAPFLSSNSLAQEPANTSVASTESSGIEVIPYLGGTSFTLKGGDADNSYRSGLQVGVLGAYGIAPKIALEVGLAYIETGSEQDYFFQKYETVYQSVAAPLLARWSFAQTERNTYFLRGGLVPSYVVSAKAKGSGILAAATEKDIMSDTKRLQLMGTFDVGTFFTLNEQTSIVGDLNYNQGFTKVSKTGDVKSQGFGLNLGVAIKL